MPEDRGSDDELKPIERKRFWIVVTSVLALAVLIGAPFFGAPPSAVIVLAAVVLISIKKAVVSYTALGNEKAALLQSFRSASQ